MPVRKTFGANRVNYVDALSPADNMATDAEVCAFSFQGQAGFYINRIIAGYNLLNGGSGEGVACRVLVLSVDGDADIRTLAKDVRADSLEAKYKCAVLLDVDCERFLDLDFSMSPILGESRTLVVVLQIPQDVLNTCLDSSLFLNVAGGIKTAAQSEIIYPPNWRGR